LQQAKYDARQSLKQQVVLPFTQQSWPNSTGYTVYPNSPQHNVEQKNSYSISNGVLNGGSHTINDASNSKSKSNRTGNLLFV